LLTVGASDQLLLAPGSITDTSGAISFGNENLTTTGTIDVGNASTTLLTVGASDQLLLAPGSITDTSGAIDFGNESLTTTGVLTFGNASSTGTTVTGVKLNGLTVYGDANITGTLTANNLNFAGGAITGVTNLTASGNLAFATASSTGLVKVDSLQLGPTAITATGIELNYVDGVTSALQTQLDAKSPLASPTFTGLTTLANASTTLANFGGGTTISDLHFGTCSVNPPSIAIGTSSLVSTSCTASGVESGYKVFVTPPSDQISDDNWLVFEGATASSTAGYIEITLFNASTTAAIDGSARTWTWMAIK